MDLLPDARAGARRRPGAGHAGRVPGRPPDPAEGDAGTVELGEERLQRALRMGLILQIKLLMTVFLQPGKRLVVQMNG